MVVDAVYQIRGVSLGPGVLDPRQPLGNADAPVPTVIRPRLVHQQGVVQRKFAGLEAAVGDRSQLSRIGDELVSVVDAGGDAITVRKLTALVAACRELNAAALE
jgi:hypothetical protein